MTLAQLHYTSAPPGPDGSGFRFTAVSAGVPQGLLREAEQLIGYEPPRDCPARPDAEQLKSFPKAFSFSELADGGRLLSRSVYIGADYSGRWGNFHAHAVHLPSGTRLPDGVLPITAWESPRWADTTPPDGRPTPVDRIEPSGLLRKDALVAFAVSRAGWLAPFFADLRAVAADPGAGQIVVVEHDSADVAQWIALACAVLPREQAHRLTFTTYTRRPQQARQQLVGALPSSESVAHDHRYRVHDCTGRQQPSGPVADTWADLCARIWRAGRPDLFHNTPEDLGQLAVTALTAGVDLRSDARTAAARWATERAGELSDETLTAVVAGLCAVPPAGSGAASRSGSGWADGSRSGSGWADGSGSAAGEQAVPPTPRSAGSARSSSAAWDSAQDTRTGPGTQGSAEYGRTAPGARSSTNDAQTGPGGYSSAGHAQSGQGAYNSAGHAQTGAGAYSSAGHAQTGAGARDSVGHGQAAPSAPDPAGDEQAALAALLVRLDGQVPTHVSAPLAAWVLASAVLGKGPVPVLRAGSLTPRAHDELARDLAPALRAGLADPTEPPAGRPLALLRVADLLDIDCQDQLPELAGRLARDLVSGTPVEPDGDRSRSRDLRAPGQPGRDQRARTGADPLPAPPTHAPRTPGSTDPWQAGTRPTPPAHSPHTPGQPGPTDPWQAGTQPARPTHAPRTSGPTDPWQPGTQSAPPARGPQPPGQPRPAEAPEGNARPAGGCPPAVLDAVHAHPGLRVALFGSLNALAAAEPAAVAQALTGSGLPIGLQPGFPHLRMCVTPVGPGDRLTQFHEVHRVAGVSLLADPAVLRTALGLIWSGELPTGLEASLLLNELGSDAHRAAGTRDLLIDAALAAPPDDRDVPALAVDLLRCFHTELPPAPHAALLLLEFTGQLGTEAESDEWVTRVLSQLARAGESVPDPVVERAFQSLARRLLEGQVPPNELYALARSGEPRLLATYEKVGRSDRVGDRLRTVPSYVADLFCDWTAFPETHPAWNETRNTLLGKVLRPVVRALPAEDQTEVEAELGRAGRGKLDAYRAWNRPGALGRLAGRLSGRGRRADQTEVWPGDVEPPTEGGRR
ncbi:GTPase-associated protein 1-related protein [Streptomyces prunicolor]|uniref:GTPase-associated protein 1-related protein n=1 Tax=Streptomyces prunicolor TaxID=67348 RepID=UPI00037F437F|nr:GTPase-associated protein 1-related protein [Streptomyces prunicolor]